MLDEIKKQLKGVARVPRPEVSLPFDEEARLVDKDALIAKFCDAEVFAGALDHAEYTKTKDATLARIREIVAGSKDVIYQDRPAELRDHEFGISACDALIADTGGAALSFRTDEESYASLLVLTSIIVARADSVVHYLGDYLAAAAGEKRPGVWTTIITGASRTADVEKILVMPAHGPRELFVLIADDAPTLNEIRAASNDLIKFK
ncbi:MAG: LUD domain-containing protein [Planctomycetes bacterium]|nr:LUD domain-containing protein [Planctomycetota bacterium]